MIRAEIDKEDTGYPDYVAGVVIPSTPLWFSPGMCKNYEYAVKVKDETFIKIFEACISSKDGSRLLYDRIAEGRWTQVNEEVVVDLTEDDS